MNIKKIWGYVAAVVFLLVLAYAYTPQVLQGKIVDQSDISGYIGMSHEATSWDAAHPDDKTAWTNSMFGGMPTTMLTGNDTGDWTKPIYKLFLLGKRPASYLFISLLGAFLLMLAFGIHPILAVGGAIAVTFCSYNMQIIQVGHNTKMQAIAFAPWVLAATVFTYRSAMGTYRNMKRRLPWTIFGAAAFALALSMQIKANHVQISYYLAIIIFSYALVLLIWAIMRHKELIGKFFIASGLLLVLGCIGIATNANRLIPTYEYTQHTMRGGSELSAGNEGRAKGLDLDYATSWSYGWEELPNMMIPNFNGGSSSGELPMDSETMTLLRKSGQQNLRQIAKHLPLYWGPQPFTAGPMYMGAITIFLFVLGLLLYKGKEKWWLLIPTVIAILLALGNHFMGFTKFWYYHVPFYNKFRTVSMALVVLQITLPVLGFLTLDRIVKGEYDRKEFTKKGLIALAITGGFCLLCFLFPSIAGTFTSNVDAGQQKVLVDALIEDRMKLLRSDALTSCLLIAATFALLWWSYIAKDDSRRRMIAGIAVCCLVLINMFAVGKRYLNADSFTTPKDFNSAFNKRPVDEMILKDTDPDYRVVDLTVNVFNGSLPSYYHKNIGGYSPVKLQRYQDLIDNYLSKELSAIYGAFQDGIATIEEAEEKLPYLPVLSMLNDKYIILGQSNPPVRNRYAFGPLWVVDSLYRTSTPDEEIAALSKVDLRTTAVLGPDFSTVEIPSSKDTATVSMVSYAPNEVRYHFTSSSPKAVVFSEIYYPEGWHAWIEDGVKTTPADRKGGIVPEGCKEIDLFRADWTLRGAVLPQGDYDVVMRFEPASYKKGTGISKASSAAILLIMLLALGGLFIPSKKEDI